MSVETKPEPEPTAMDGPMGGPTSDGSVATQPPRSPGGAWVRRWPVAVLLAILGGAAGVGYVSTLPVTYTSEARVAVGAGDLSSGAIAGFPLAATQLASNYARYINDQALVGPARVRLAATPIPDSNIIRIVGASSEKQVTNQEVEKTAESLVAQVNTNGADDQTLTDFVKASQAWATATAAQDSAKSKLDRLLSRNQVSQADVDAARTQLAQLTSATDVADLKKESLGQKYTTEQTASTAANLTVAVKATPIGDDLSSLRQRYGLLGAVAGLALSLVVAVLLERRRPRGRRIT